MRSILNAQPGPRDLKQFASSIFEGRGPECGRLPNATRMARCCRDGESRLVIEFAGRDPYLYPETPWRAVCRPA